MDTFSGVGLAYMLVCTLAMTIILGRWVWIGARKDLDRIYTAPKARVERKETEKPDLRSVAAARRAN